MSANPLDFIRSRTREEWVRFARDKWINLRIFVQENGEIGLISGFVFGLFVVLFFKFFITLLILALLSAGLVWNLAPSELEQPPKNNQDISPPDL